jgi:hypothetical protein
MSMLSKGTSFKARRAVQIRKLEKELLILSKRYDQISDPVYYSELRQKLKQVELKF